MIDTKALMKVLNKYGSTAQEDICIEEMSELTKAILKHRRAGKFAQGNLNDTLSDIVEETADVEICLEYIKLIYSQTAPDFCERVQQMIDYKVRRVERRIEMAKSADVQEVVRCKDCKHLKYDRDFTTGRYCSLRNVNGGKYCKDDDFCSYGKRKDGNER